MFRRIIATSSSWVPVPLRLALGAIFIAHGAQKVLGSFGGPGFKAWIAYPAPFPFMKPAWLWMAAAALAELIGGILIVLGLFTRVGAFLIACVMVSAMIGVHWHNGFFLGQQPGIEYALALVGAALALLISGGGAVSVDRALTGRRP